MEKTKRQRRIIVSLSAALGVAGITAIVAPTMVAVLHRSGSSVLVTKIIFSAGEHGYFTDSSGKQVSTLEFTGEKGKAIGSIVTAARTSITANTNFSFTGWYLPDGTIVTEQTILPVADSTTITAQYLEKDVSNINIHFSIDSTTESLQNFPNTTISVPKGKTYADLKKSFPNAIRQGYEFRYWVLNKGSEEQIKSDYTFTSSISLYPCFLKNDNKSIIQFNFVAAEGQTFTGTTTFDIEYDKSAPNAVTWSSIKTWPTVKEGEKEFGGWYHDSDHSIPWEDDDPINPTDCTAYAEMITVDYRPVITFAVPEDAEHPELYTWYGNQIIKCTENEVTFDSITKPIPFYDADGDPTTGITTDYYFKGWYTLNDAGERAVVPGTIDKSYKIYPEFDQKPEYKFAKVDGDETVTDTIKLDPNIKFKEVAVPTASTTKSDVWFIGWKQTWKDSEGEEQTFEINPNTSVLEIDKDLVIKPNYQANCNVLTFSKQGKVNDVVKTEDIVNYTGNPEVGMLMTEPHSFSSINIPIANPISDDYTFVGWEYKKSTEEGEDKWQPLDSGVEFPSSTSQVKYDVRPLLQSKVQISFNDGEHASINASSWYVPGTTVYKVEPDTPFKEIYTPIVDVESGYIFQGWATRTGTEGSYEYTLIDSNQKFTSDTQLYPYCVEDGVSSTVNFHLKPEDISSPYKTTIAGSTITVNHDAGTDKYFEDIPHATVTKHLYTHVGWDIKAKDGSYIPIPDKYVLPCGKTPLDVYARFEPNESYHVVSVKAPQGSEYEIVGDNTVFIKHGESLEINDSTQLFGIEVKTPGTQITGWTLEDGKTPVTSETEITEDTIVVPVLATCYRQVVLSKNGDTTITGFNEGDGFTIKNYGYLLPALTEQGIKPSKPQSDFIGWQIKNGDEDYTTVTDSTIVTTATVTVVPLFRGESEFKYGERAYYFDSEKKQWAAIKSYDKAELEVYYANGETGTKDKSTFNYEVRFGEQMKTVPDNFMLNCIAWNNGNTTQSDDNTLHMPTDLYSVGSNVLKNCQSFNQKIDFSGSAASLTFDEGFMDNCLSFNQDIDFTYAKAGATITLGNGFMHDCQNFVSTLTFTNRTVKASGATTMILNTSNSYCAFAHDGFKVKVDDQTAFQNLLDKSTVVPYRNYQFA